MHFTATLYGYSDDLVLDQAKQLLGEFINSGNYHVCGLLERWLAEMELHASAIDSYVQSVKDLFNRRSAIQLKNTSEGS